LSPWAPRSHAAAIARHDKLEPVIYSVRHYKARCVTRYDAVVRDSTSPGELIEAFAEKLAQTIRDEGPMHRLWHDLRTQSMFEKPLREAITEIEPPRRR
jgi:TetR/AcrR family transcriptional regulator, transcriptional repressor of bet genes